MGTFGYNETIWVISDECALRKTVSIAGDTCCVCRKEIKTITCFMLDELYYNRNKIKSNELDKRFCHKCVRKLVTKKEIVSR